MEWTTAASFSARVGIAGYQYRHLIQKHWKTIQAKFDIGSTEILITGRPNVGKNVLLEQMQGYARELAYTLPKESKEVDVGAVTLGDTTKIVRVLPGQSSLVRTVGLNSAFDENKNLEGIFHVVDFGYTAPRDPTIAQSLITDSKKSTLDDLREYNLENEIDELKNLIVSIERSHAKHNTPKWLAVIVNKVDLFKKDIHNALAFYHPAGGSRFSHELKKLQEKIGSNSLPIYVLSTCSYEQDFVWNGETIASSLEIQEQRTIVRDFMITIESISKEKK